MTRTGTGLMAEVHHKLALLHCPTSSAPSHSLLYAGLQRYALLEWLFFRFPPSLPCPHSPSRAFSWSLLSTLLVFLYVPHLTIFGRCSRLTVVWDLWILAGFWGISLHSRSKVCSGKVRTAMKRLHAFSVCRTPWTSCCD